MNWLLNVSYAVTVFGFVKLVMVVILFCSVRDFVRWLGLLGVSCPFESR